MPHLQHSWPLDRSHSPNGVTAMMIRPNGWEVSWEGEELTNKLLRFKKKHGTSCEPKMGTDFLKVAIASDGYPSDIAKLLQSVSSLRCQTKISKDKWFHLFNNKKGDLMMLMSRLEKEMIGQVERWRCFYFDLFFYVFLLHCKNIHQVEIQVKFLVLLMWNIRIGLCNLQTNGCFDLGDVSATKSKQVWPSSVFGVSL